MISLQPSDPYNIHLPDALRLLPPWHPDLQVPGAYCKLFETTGWPKINQNKIITRIQCCWAKSYFWIWLVSAWSCLGQKRQKNASQVQGVPATDDWAVYHGSISILLVTFWGYTVKQNTNGNTNRNTKTKDNGKYKANDKQICNFQVVFIPNHW